MSARNYLSARDKINKLIDSLPSINPQKFGYRTGQELPPLSANTGNLVNRNLSYSYEHPNFRVNNSLDRAGTPFSDFFSESETGTPDFRSEESDSSAGSALRRNTAEATKALTAEWERIERTLYDEDGEKTTRPNIIEECNQWKQLHPQLRVIGKALSIPEKKLSYRQIEHEEVIAVQYTDYENFSESEERLSQSSTDITPENSPRISIAEDFEPKLSREKVSFYPTYDENGLPDTFCSLLQITPMHIRSPSHRKRNIIRSDIASSRWMRNSRPDSSVHDRNSAKSFVSLDTRNLALSASERKKISNRVVTARQRDGKLEPLYTPESTHNELRPLHFNIRKVSLPPLLLDEEKKKVAAVNSAKKVNIKPRKSVTRTYYQLDKMK